MEEDESNSSDQESYYAVLNVPRDASEETIKKSYRQLAQACHPDKVSDPDVREHAARNFTKIQEAYEVLSHEEKRTIYDIYGKKGLESGLEVGEHLGSPSDLKRQFEQFRRKQAEQREEARVAHRGAYIFKVDACELMNPYDRDVDCTPELTSVATNNSVQIPLSDTCAASIGCQVAVRKKVGGGSFVCGLKRILTESDTLEVHGAVGLKMFGQLQVSRRLSQHTSASMAATWQPGAGIGLTVSSSRQLGLRTEADWTWQVGPETMMGCGFTRRGEKLFVSCRLETGASMGIVGKLAWQATASLSLRASAKLGTMGIELETGAVQQVTEFSTAGCSVLAGIQGIVVKPRFSRGGHTFEVPLLLSQSAQDYPVLVAAYLLPPFLALATKYCILKPLKRRARVRKAVEQRLRHVRQVQAAIQEAASAARVMQPVATRKLRSEQDKGGLVVASAKYGLPAAVREAELAERRDHQSELPGSEAGSPSPTPAAFRARLAGADVDSDEEEEEVPADSSIQEAVEASLGEAPPSWLDVTTAVRFMVNQGALHFHKGVSKSGLMGFCDVVPGDEKILVVTYLWQGRAYSLTLGDKAEGSIPRDGSLLAPGSDQAAHIQRQLQQEA